MGTTLQRRLVPAASAAPAQARPITPSRMPQTITSAPTAQDPLATAVTPLGAATTAAGVGRRGPVSARGRRPRRTPTGHPRP